MAGPLITKIQSSAQITNIDKIFQNVINDFQANGVPGILPVYLLT